MNETASQERFAAKVMTWIAETDRTSLLGLVIANLLALVLCLMFGWDVASIVIFYWVENLVIGFYSIFRILLASGDGFPRTYSESKRKKKKRKRKKKQVKGARVESVGFRVFLAGFFTVHYFGFCLGHGLFLTIALNFSSMFDSNAGGLPLELFHHLPTGTLLAILALIISHGISFVRNYIYAGECLRVSPGDEMFRPYGRIMLLHICIILGMFVVTMFGSHVALVVLFVLAKTVVDAVVHSYSHRTEPETKI